jgi:hypothetical protein
MLPYSIPPGIPFLDVERLFRGITVCLRDGNFVPCLRWKAQLQHPGGYAILSQPNMFGAQSKKGC